MTTPELQDIRNELSENVRGLGAELIKFDANGRKDPFFPVVEFDSSLLEPLMGDIDPDTLSDGDKTKHLEEMRRIGSWRGGRSDDWKELRTAWMTISAESYSEHNGLASGAGPNMSLTLEDYSKTEDNWNAVRIHTDIVRARRFGKSEECELIGARVLGEAGPSERLVVPTLEQVVAINGIVGALRRILQVNVSDMA